MKNEFKTAGAALFMALAASFSARADIKYTQVISAPSGKNGALKPMTTSTTWVRAGQRRLDSSTQIMSFDQSETTITICAKKQRVRFDNALKIYTSESLYEKPDAVSVVVSGRETIAPPKKTAKKTGKIVSTIALKSLGTEKIAGRTARRYLLTSDVKTSGCAGNGEMHSKQELWMADVDMPVVNCPDAKETAMPTSLPQIEDGCDCTIEQKGDIAALASAFKGVVLKMKMLDAKTDKPMMAMETTMLSSAKLGDADFAVPAGFKKLSAQEYDEARSKAMMKAMMGGTMEEAIKKATQIEEANDADTGAKQNAETANSETASAETSDAEAVNADHSDSSDEDAAREIAKKMGKKLPRF